MRSTLPALSRAASRIPGSGLGDIFVDILLVTSKRRGVCSLELAGREWTFVRLISRSARKKEG